MAKQILKPWIIPIVGSDHAFFVDSIHDDDEGFRIILVENQISERKLKITFSSTISYRNTDESFLLKIWNDVDQNLLGKIFYTISDSEYIDFFNQMTFGLYKEWKVVHYAIYTLQDCLDILSDQPPKIEWIKCH